MPEPPARRDPVTLLTRRVLPLALVAVVFAALAVLASLPLGNFDTYFHLRFGAEFLDGWSLRDPGSVTTFATADWVPTQWLPQVVMAWVESRVGLAGVAWLAGLQFLSLALALYLAARRWADPVVAAPLLMIALLACGSGLSMRPQVWSYVLVVVVSATWIRTHESGRTPWFLIPLTWLWAMVHGMWPVGIVVGLVAVVAIGLDRRGDARTLLRHLAVPALSALVAALTPVGPGLYRAVLVVSARGDFFPEWGPPDFTQANNLALLALLAIPLVVGLRSPTTDWLSIALVGLAAGFAVYSQRTVPVAAALVLPFAAIALQRLLGASSHPDRIERVVVRGAWVGALVVLALVVPRTADRPPPQPEWVEPTLGALPEGTAVLNSSGFGGYLMWRYPQLDLVTSGYGDVYTTEELQRNYDIESVRPGWIELVRDLAVPYALAPPDSPLGYALREGEGWEVLEDDPDVQLLRAPPGWFDE